MAELGYVTIFCGREMHDVNMHVRATNLRQAKGGGAFRRLVDVPGSRALFCLFCQELSIITGLGYCSLW